MMTKRDTIIVAVLINICVLAALFIFAVNKEEDQVSDPTELGYTLEETPLLPTPQYEPIVMTTSTPSSSIDEVDDVLNAYASTTTSSSTVQEKISQDEPLKLPIAPKENTPKVEPKQRTIDVTVKKGDALEKIARNNGTTVEEIKKLNQLNSERLDVGQVLKIPTNKEIKASSSPSSPSSSPTAKTSSEVVYYTIKSGDNPWKIARQFRVKYEDILRWNNLNEEKARNLKVGDKIRVK
jgi:LysM repeat protein